MTTIQDVSVVQVQAGAAPILVNPLSLEVKLVQPIELNAVTVVNPGDIATSQLIVAGPQGPPGLQNVFVSSTPPDPRLQAGYNVNTKYVWIDIS